MSPPIKSFIQLVEENRRPGMIVVEVGVAYGETSMGWLPIIKAEKGLGILVDNFRGFEIHEPPDVACDKLVKRLESEGYDDNLVMILYGDSLEAAREISNHFCDLVFIDADHRYSHVKSDIETWLPKVRPGGILSGHDFEDYAQRSEVPVGALDKDFIAGRHWGVCLAVTERFGSAAQTLPADVWWLRP